MDEISTLGIDLGTTNSAIAIWDLDTNQMRILENPEGERLTPSIVTWDPETTDWVVIEGLMTEINHPPVV